MVIVGGAIMGSSTAWWLAELGFTGSILVVERDPSYAACSSTHTNSCIRQQFSDPLNIRMSQFTVEFIRNFRERSGDTRVPEIQLNSFGYLYLADNEGFAGALRATQQVQQDCGAGTRILTPEEILAEYPFYNMDGILLGSLKAPRLRVLYADGTRLTAASIEHLAAAPALEILSVNGTEISLGDQARLRRLKPTLRICNEMGQPE